MFSRPRSTCPPGASVVSKHSSSDSTAEPASTHFASAECTTSSEPSNELEQQSSNWPQCWTCDQWLSFSAKNNWLQSCNGTSGCSICQSISGLGVRKEGLGVRSQLPEEWVKGTVGPNGKDNKAHQMSLRKKIFLHKNSKGHIEAANLCETQCAHSLQTSVSAQTEGDTGLTTVVFRTAYYIAKSDRPYTDHPDLLDLQQLNGIKVGRVL